MAISEDDRDQIETLVREGKHIADVWREDYPKLSYDDVYWAARGRGARSALGAKRMITSRLRKAKGAKSTVRRADLIENTEHLVAVLYEDHKRMARKLRSIRDALDR